MFFVKRFFLCASTFCLMVVSVRDNKKLLTYGFGVEFYHASS
jgi:hypothetical protein